MTALPFPLLFLAPSIKRTISRRRAGQTPRTPLGITLVPGLAVQKYRKSSNERQRNMASDRPADMTRRDVRVLQGDDRADVLHRFGECASVLRDVLYDDRVLDEEEFIFIDKHFQILNIAYLRWKRKHRPTDESRPTV